VYFKTLLQVNSGCGLSTVVACKLGLSTVAVFQTRLQINSGSVCGLSTVVACKLALSTGVFQKLVVRLTLVLFVFVYGRCMHTWYVNGGCIRKTRVKVNSGSVCGVSTVVPCKLGMSTVGFF